MSSLPCSTNLDLCSFKGEFSQYYDRTYDRKSNTEVAFKDIVGQEYEQFRKNTWNMVGLSAVKEKIADYEPDLVVKNNKGQILVIEEDKGHYVDLCFLKRFYSNAAEITQYFLDNSMEVPYIILSCPTEYSLFEAKKDKIINLYRQDIAQVLRTKVKYLSFCSHDRIRPKAYYASEINDCFKLDDDKIRLNIDFMNNISN